MALIPMWLMYEGKALRWAVEHTWHTACRPFIHLIVITALLPVALWATLQGVRWLNPSWLPQGWEEAVAWEWLVAVAGLGLVGAAIGVEAFISVILAPSRLEQHAASKTSELSEAFFTAESARLRLENEHVPTISAIHKTGEGRFGVGAHLMWAELEVKNTSRPRPLTKAQARIVRCESLAPDQDNPDEFKNLGHALWDWSPITLTWAQSDSESVNIPGGASRTVLIAFSDISSGPPAVFNDNSRTQCSDELKITVEISSPDTATWHASYYIQCQPKMVRGYEDRQWIEDAHFEFAPWEEWTATRTVTDVVTAWSTPATAGSLDTSLAAMTPRPTELDAPTAVQERHSAIKLLLALGVLALIGAVTGVGIVALLSSFG